MTNVLCSRFAVLAVLVASSVAVFPPGVSATVQRVQLSDLDGATAPRTFTLVVDFGGATSAKLVVDGRYVGKDDRQPLEFAIEVAPGQHDVRVKSIVDGGEVRTDATFTASNTPSSSTSVPKARPGEVVVATVDQIRAAFATAHPGDVIVVADGEYTFKPRLVAAASGTKSSPITVRGSRNAVIRTKNASGDYGLHITGDYWRIEGITVAHATKGIVLDGSVGTVIDGVEVYDIGDEAVHFRSCSSDGVLRNSFIHDTGRNSPQYGEGVYVGSANSNWSKYQCTDRLERSGTGDNTERVLIENNEFEDITAEGADLKEGTDSGTLRRNVFRRAGLSGQNSADSAVDAKGNNWVIEDNVVSQTDATWDDDGVASPSEFLDGFQTHQVYDGYGTGNVFSGNRVSGQVPGFAIGLYPKLRNVVMCDNVASGAEMGLVGDASKPASCRP